jgi:hypothetical protein
MPYSSSSSVCRPVPLHHYPSTTLCWQLQTGIISSTSSKTSSPLCLARHQQHRHSSSSSSHQSHCQLCLLLLQLCISSCRKGSSIWRCCRVVNRMHHQAQHNSLQRPCLATDQHVTSPTEIGAVGATSVLLPGYRLLSGSVVQHNRYR